jgi:hypothetical protein
VPGGVWGLPRPFLQKGRKRGPATRTSLRAKPQQLPKTP